MIESAIILGLMLPAFLLAYLGLNLKDNHSVMRMFLVLGSLVMSLGAPITAWQMAKNQSVEVVQDYLIWFELAMVVIFVVLTFYMIWLYIKATSKTMSGNEDMFQMDDMGD